MTNGTAKITVTYFHRRPRSVENYSIERLYSQIRHLLTSRIESQVCTCHYASSGLFRRIYNTIEASFRQGAVNHITGDVNYLGLLMRKRSCVQTILDCGYLQNAVGLKKWVLLLFWLKLPAIRCHTIVTISEFTKQQITEFASCTPGKIKVVYVPLPHGFFRNDKPFNTERTRILQLGAAPNKNIDRLIQALTGLSVHLDLVGRYESRYEQLLQQSGISYSYRCNLSESEIISAYHTADIISLVSTYEGFGLPIIEGQAVGRVVVAGNAASIPEVAGAGACLVDPYDISSIRLGFKRVIEDHEYRENLIAHGFENVKRFCPELIANQYFEIYKELAAGY